MWKWSGTWVWKLLFKYPQFFQLEWWLPVLWFFLRPQSKSGVEHEMWLGQEWDMEPLGGGISNGHPQALNFTLSPVGEHSFKVLRRVWVEEDYLICALEVAMSWDVGCVHFLWMKHKYWLWFTNLYLCFLKAKLPYWQEKRSETERLIRDSHRVATGEGPRAVSTWLLVFFIQEIFIKFLVVTRCLDLMESNTDSLLEHRTSKTASSLCLGD